MARLLLLLVALSILGCQTDMRGYEPGWDELHVTRSRSEVELLGRYRDEQRSGTSAQGDLQETEFRETWRVLFAGFYYHPKLVEFDVDLELGLEQRDSRSGSGRDLGSDGLYSQYRFGINLLKDQAYGVNVFASRREIRTRQNFFETNEALTETEGFSVRAREWWVPSTLTYQQYRFTGLRGFQYLEDRTSWRLEGQRSGELGEFRYVAEILDLAQLGVLEQITDRRFTSSYRRSGGLGDRNVFRTLLTANDRDGAGDDYARARWNTSYRHHWTRDFSGDLTADLTRSELNASTVDGFSLFGGLRHQLFASLTSTVSANWLHTEYDVGTGDSFSQSGSLAYRKRVPFGLVRASQSLTSRVQSRDALGGTIVVIGEPQVYTPGTPLLLDSPNVDINSVVVRDSSGLLIYTEGVDYFLVQVGIFVRIDIPVSSLISPGDTILVDYEYQPSPARRSQTLTSRSAAGVRVGEGVDFDISYQTSESRVLSGVDDGSLPDSRRLNALLQAYPVENLVMGAEYEDFVSERSPFIRYRLFASWSRAIGARSDFSSSADAYRVERTDTGTQSGGMARVSLNTRLGTTANATLSAQYRRTSYAIDEGEGYLFEATYRKRFGRTGLRAGVQWFREEFDVATDQDVLRFEVIFTRSF